MSDVKIIYPDLNISERREMMQQDAMQVLKDEVYQEPLSDEEIAVRQELFKQMAITLADMDDKKKEFMDQWKAEQKPLMENYRKTLTELRTGQVSKRGDLFDMATPDGLVERVNEEGRVINTRKMRPGESRTLFQGNSKMFVPGGFKTGTND